MSDLSAEFAAARARVGATIDASVRRALRRLARATPMEAQDRVERAHGRKVLVGEFHSSPVVHVLGGWKPEPSAYVRRMNEAIRAIERGDR